MFSFSATRKDDARRSKHGAAVAGARLGGGGRASAQRRGEHSPGRGKSVRQGDQVIIGAGLSTAFRS
jgi:hypothetical protein